jgi:glycosyltransferase involved in cell wall biosynthesis
MKPRLAVVIPVYNHARFIPAGLETVLGQTRPPDRVLVIDDGSRDNSLEVMEPFKKRGVEIRGRENRGAHATINELIAEAAADCDFIAILNSDDLYLPRRFERLLDLAERQPEKAVYCSRLEVIDGNGDKMDPGEPRARWFYGVQSLGADGGLSPAEWMGRGNFIATTSNVMARADYLRANPFRDYRFIHDYFFLAGAALRDRIAVCDEVLLQYRVHGSNTITTKPEPLIREMLKMHLDLLKFHAPELRADPAMRERFYSYSLGLWSNVSAMHAGMLQVLLAQLAARADDDEIADLVAGMGGPEFEITPNRTLAGAFEGGESLSAALLSQRVETLRGEREKLAADRAELDALARLRATLAGSRWVALGNLLGQTRALHANTGSTPSEKLAALRAACASSAWLRLGARLGSRSGQV